MGVHSLRNPFYGRGSPRSFLLPQAPRGREEERSAQDTERSGKRCRSTHPCLLHLWLCLVSCDCVYSLSSPPPPSSSFLLHPTSSHDETRRGDDSRNREESTRRSFEGTYRWSGKHLEGERGCGWLLPFGRRRTCWRAASPASPSHTRRPLTSSSSVCCTCFLAFSCAVDGAGEPGSGVRSASEADGQREHERERGGAHGGEREKRGSTERKGGKTTNSRVASFLCWLA